jgi:DNA-binding transcriptional regulator/RsmH inhibitor MraZ
MIEMQLKELRPRIRVIGVGGAFEIWDPQAALDQDDPDLREIAAFHLDAQDAA